MIRGEYWILPGGETLFADGDISDVRDHEAWAIWKIREVVHEAIGLDYDQDEFAKDWEEAVIEHFQPIRGEEEPRDLGCAGLLEWALKHPELYPQLNAELVAHAVWGTHESKGTDAKRYVMKHYRWKWYRMGAIGMHLITRDDFEDLCKGIEKILDEEDVEPDHRQTFTVGAEGSAKVFELTYTDIETRNYEGLQFTPTYVHLGRNAQVARLDADLVPEFYRPDHA